VRGLGGNDTLWGGFGHDTLDGGTGADTLFGCEGDDRYIVDSLYDRVIEAGGLGYDTVLASVSYTLGEALEALILTGAAAINGVGNGAGNFLQGNAAANALYGGGGSDRLLGGAGNDILDGGLDSDRLEGGFGSDRLYGGAGADWLSGGAGADLLYGGAGIDTYLFDAATGAGDILYDDAIRDDILLVSGAGVRDGAAPAPGEALGGAGSSVAVSGTGSLLTIGLGAASIRIGSTVTEVVLFDTAGARGSQYQHFLWDAADQRYEFSGFS
jgi:Ca2+-binding RTX toxin-like protein